MWILLPLCMYGFLHFKQGHLSLISNPPILGHYLTLVKTQRVKDAEAL